MIERAMLEMSFKAVRPQSNNYLYELGIRTTQYYDKGIMGYGCTVALDGIRAHIHTMNAIGLE